MWGSYFVGCSLNCGVFLFLGRSYLCGGLIDGAVLYVGVVLFAGWLYFWAGLKVFTQRVKKTTTLAVRPVYVKDFYGNGRITLFAIAYLPLFFPHQYQTRHRQC